MTSEARRCPFCTADPARVFFEDERCLALWDGFAVTPGHALVIPRRHVASWFDTTREEQLALLETIDVAREEIMARHDPDGFNIGINVGEAAGQTVFHLHIHVIPRYRGDVEDPTGGVRGVIPHKANYRRQRAQALSIGAPTDPFLRHLLPLFEEATEIAIVAAFVQNAGLNVLAAPIQSALARGVGLRLLAGDYLNITQAEALARLLNWQRGALLSEDLDTVPSSAAAGRGELEARIIETKKLTASSFHPKAWLFKTGDRGVAFVGSSNISIAALETGVEWNLRLDRGRDPLAFAEIEAAFEELWRQGRRLDRAWIDRYREQSRKVAAPFPPGDIEEEVEPAAPDPNAFQVAALEALAQSRKQGRKRALVVLATGLGKTYLASLDVAALDAQRDTPTRVLFLAHRAELLRQAAETFRRQRPDACFGWFAGERDELTGDVVLASVQKLSRPEHLEALQATAFDYVIIDEVHHATAASYRRILAHVEPRFLLGLTATPDRADEADVLGLFDDHVAYRADLPDGIEAGRLVPFDYFGIRDTVDYKPIPWRNRRFDPAQLARAVQTEDRMSRLWAAWRERRGTRTLVFCCSIAHADHAGSWLREHGVRVAVVHSGEGSADRAAAIRQLEAGELDAICTVDLFNEGVDIPSIDRVVMLRPTESPVVFLQQLGRGLREAEGKTRLVVIDFVGNHRVFVERLRQMAALGGLEQNAARRVIEAGGALELPAGCSVKVELEAVELLVTLLSRRADNETIRLYRELRDARGERPRAGELYRLGRTPRAISHADGWFGFVRDEGDFAAGDAALAVLGDARARRWLKHLETSSMTKCFKMVTLQVLLDAERLEGGMELEELARRAHALLSRSPDLMLDLQGVKDLHDPERPDPSAWLRYWNKNPVHFWSRGEWFAVEEDRLISRVPRLQDRSAREALHDMTEELVDFRLAQYRTRLQSAEGAFETRVTWNKRDPILKLPSRKKLPQVPTGETPVRLDDGQLWLFRMRKEFCNVARPAGEQRNQLPDLMRRWFGPVAGHPGTRFAVRFSAGPDGWWAEPVGAKVIPFPTRGRLVAYPELRAAAGVTGTELVGAPDVKDVVLPLEGTVDEQCFAVRAAGDSMDGGREPIRDGDWVVLRWARGQGLGSVVGRVCMIAAGHPEEGMRYHLKRVVPGGERGHVLRSDNPAVEPMSAEGAVVHAIKRHVVRPESLAPEEGSLVDDAALAEAFGLSESPRPLFSRIDGHLFVQVERAGILVAPDRMQIPDLKAMPGETAYVLVRAAEEGPWRYCGVGRQRDNLWTVPALDYASWTVLGESRAVSRTLEPQLEKRAEQLVANLLQDNDPAHLLGQQGKQLRILGRASRGGLRIDGGAGGFAERTVSLADIGWVLAAKDHFGPLVRIEEPHVNRLRYLEGTPKSSTRYIDTSWALFVVESEESSGAPQT